MENIAKSPLIASRPSPAPHGLGNGTLSPLTLELVSCGGIGALLFTAIYLIEGATRPGYDGWQQPISALSLGPGGWVQQVNFVVYGALLVLSAVGWYRFLSPVRGAIRFPLLQGIGGLCLIGAGVVSTDPFPGYPLGPGRDHRRCMGPCMGSSRGCSFWPWPWAALPGQPWCTLHRPRRSAGGTHTHW